MSVQKRSAIWNVFTETHKTDYIATCNICSQEFSYRSTTTNLMKHLKRKHPEHSVTSTYVQDKYIENKYIEEKHQEVEIVIERQLENECKIESFKVEVKPATDEESPDFIVLGSGKRSSHLWDFFQRIPDSDYMAACNSCDSQLSYKTTITNLKRHLQRKHTELIKECSQPENEFQEQLQPFDPSNDDNVENIENNANPPVNNSVEENEDDFWNLQDEPESDKEFRPSPEHEDEFEFKLSNSCKKRSQIWNVFTEKPGSDYVAFCNVCKQEFCYRSTTNNLKKHFERKHKGMLMDTKIDLVKPEVHSPDDKFYERMKNYSSDDEIDDKNEEEKTSRRKPSQIWKYFTKKNVGEYVAYCNICKKELGYRSTTSNLKKHLDRKHPQIKLVKSEVELEKPIPEASLKTCLICLQTDATEGIEFMQVNSCDPEEKSYMLKIQEIMNQSVDIDESHVLCQPCIIDLEKVLNFKDKIMKAFEFWSKIEPEPEPDEPEPVDISADDPPHHSDYSDLEDGESLAKFTCSKCHKVFASPSIMLKHNCDQIKKQKSIQKRVKFADRDSKFYCDHCGKGFSIKWKLSKHIKRSSSRHKHMRSHNAKPGEKSKKTPFLCTICGKSFPYSNGASRHMRVHFGERRHECHICLKRFSQTTHLKVHLRTHSGERPYNCVICSRTFSLNASLRKHMRLHVGSGDIIKLVNNMDANLDTNMEDNLGNNISMEMGLKDDDMQDKFENNLTTTLVTNLGVMEHLGSELDSDLETNIVHAEVVTEDGIHVLTHHDIALEEDQCAG
ncbi:unnamed protein product [Psylliodes chrysocephalus]|uniref:Uncharacterized protein n=1 Tax=Psylliodes chrysocephalus TaxID=3402493 RepID=A0A9P0G964_9CUCU|nr:unnamed protein product [Psylliodes chrysocephala]